MSCVESWPEPIVPVQSLVRAGLREIPRRYVKPLPQRPMTRGTHSGIPVIDLAAFRAGNPELLDRVREACREWGFFQLVNHGVDPDLLDGMRALWGEFFDLPVEEKRAYANSPATYEGYGSRVGVGKDALLDWSDYFFLVYLPRRLRDPSKWPAAPSALGPLSERYAGELEKLCVNMMKILSMSLGLGEDTLSEAFGVEQAGGTLRVNFYPRCPQPDLTLGLSSHSDPGGLTLLYSDLEVPGLQVKKGSEWVLVSPLPNAFIVNIGDQVQVLTNGQYKSVEHRAVVNSEKERMSMAFFFNPKEDLPIQPIKDLVDPDHPAKYQAMSYKDYRVFIRTEGLRGKAQVHSLESSS